jgi:fructose-bisphosphate aldolase class II/tagatose 1,6-diphosphate aldolase GatY/KbaY
MDLKTKLVKLREDRKAILATNFYNYETLAGVLQAASEAGLPLILQLSESSIRYMGLKVAVAMAKSAIKQSGVKAWLHLDHGSSIEMVRECLDEGFDSVMIDASEKSLDENIGITRKVVKIAGFYNACVEAELGFIAKLGQSHGSKGFTRPDEAARYAESTGVNSLAVAIGSAHGFYKLPPNLNIDLLSEISSKTPVPLVLHGSSGIPDNMLIEAIKNGICKINLATEIKNIFMLSLKEKLKDTTEIDLRIVFPDAIKAVKDLVGRKLQVINH